MLKRVFDIIFSLLFLLLLAPLLVAIAIWIKIDSTGPVFFLQKRVGLNGKDFHLIKLRSMRVGADQHGLLTIGGRDRRITRSGHFIRKYKLDELPQLINVLLGQMSVVGPRPEVHKYVALYNPEQRRVLTVKPGISDFASIRYRNENELLAKHPDPERFYIEQIMPDKLRLNLEYVDNRGLLADIRVIIRTLKVIFWPS